MAGVGGGRVAPPLAPVVALALVAALALGGAVLAHAALFGSFSTWDDEGYLLLALRAWREGGGLYDRVDTIYGPFYFQAVAAASSMLQIPLDNVGARWITLAIWTAAPLACFACVRRISRSFLAGLLAWALSFGFLVALANEPLHPGGIGVLLLALLALLATRFDPQADRPWTWAAAGALVAAIALVKLNVGAFALLAALGLLARSSSRSATMLGARALLGSALVALPFVLMRALLAEGWVLRFALLASASLAPFVVLLFVAPAERPWGRKTALAFVAGGLALALASIGACLAGGTTLAGMWRALVLDSLRFPAATRLAPLLSEPALVLAMISLLAALALGRRTRPLATLAASLFVLWQCVRLEAPLAALPCLWACALPLGDAPRAHAPRFFLALLACLQGLHVYPVAGSQTGFFGFLVPVVGVVALWDAGAEIARSWSVRLPAPIARAWPVAFALSSAALLALSHPAWRELPNRWQRYRRASVELALPGAETLRLPEWQATALQWLAANVERNSDAFVAEPGLHSLYLWTGQRPPVPFYSHVWPLFYGEDRQRALGAALLARERPAYVRSREILAWWLRGASPPESALARAIDERFAVAAQAFGFELLLPRGRAADLVLSAIRCPLPEGTPPELADRIALRVALPGTAGTRFARYALVHVETGAVLCDTAAGSPDERIVLADGRGHDVFLLCPPSIRRQSSGSFLVRCFDERSEIVARLAVVR